LDFLKLHVYDLYYKKRSIIHAWWDDCDDDGSVTIGLEHEFA